MNVRYLFIFSAFLGLLLPDMFGQGWRDLGAQKGVAGMAQTELVAYHHFQFDMAEMEQALSLAPVEHSGAYFELELPSPTGELETFLMVSYELLPDPLAAKFPQIQTLKGWQQSDPTTVVHLDITDWGLNAIVLGSEGTYFLEPVDRQHRNQVIAYWSQDVISAEPKIQDWCGAEDVDAFQREGEEHLPETIGTDMLVYRFAVVSDVSYTNNYGGVSGAMSAITTLVNQTNAITERDLAIRLQLIPNNDLLIFSGTSPFSDPGFVNDMINEAQGIVDGIIPSNSYDIGHTLTAYQSGSGGAAGIASLASVCTNGKARGVTSTGNGPFGSTAFLGTFTHEVGHQLGSPHTFNGTAGGCNGNISGSTAYEPGSGSTLVAYPGLCGTHNVAFSREFYYHAASIETIIGHTRNGGGTCASLLDNMNAEPSAVPPVGGFSIPIGTPFMLTGFGNDTDGDSLTYCWEQYDLGPSGHPDFPIGNAPIFRSFLPAPEQTRIFPRIENILSNFQQRGELLPSYSRDLTFRLTVRDQKGGVTYNDVSFEASEVGGPFLVTYPNTNLDWTIGTYEEITWDVANTNLPPINCEKVNIHLSTDGGFTFPHFIASDIPNDGSEIILVPNLPSDSVRLRVSAADNIFFDLSNQNFTIEAASQPGVSVFFGTDEAGICADGTTDLTLLTTSLLSYNDPITFVAGGLPTGINLNYSPNPFLPGDTVHFTFDSDGSTPVGSYPISISAVGAGITPATNTLTLEVSDQLPGAISDFSPADGSNGVATETSFGWTPASDAQTYRFELATSPAFGASVIASSDELIDPEFFLSFPLAPNTTYYWRSWATNICGEGPQGQIQAFHTGQCTDTASIDVPQAIAVFGAPIEVTSSLVVGVAGQITDVNVVGLQGLHESVSELTVSLISPNNTEVKLFSNQCQEIHQDFVLNFDEEAQTSIFDCPPVQGATYQPLESLSTFYGEDAAGIWTLKVVDSVNFSGGELQSWGLQICTNAGTVFPQLITNDPLTVRQWNADTINTALLEATDGVSAASELVYTLVNEPQRGAVLLNGTALNAGDFFSQDDLNQERLIYQHNGSFSPVDSFRFDVRNQLGGWVGVFAFQIDVTSASSRDAILADIGLSLFPNPAQEQVEVQLSGLSGQDIQMQLLNLQGQHLWQQKFGRVTDRAQTTIPVRQLAAGMYLLQVEVDGQSLYRKLMVE